MSSSSASSQTFSSTGSSSAAPSSALVLWQNPLAGPSNSPSASPSPDVRVRQIWEESFLSLSHIATWNRAMPSDMPIEDRMRMVAFFANQALVPQEPNWIDQDMASSADRYPSIRATQFTGWLDVLGECLATYLPDDMESAAVSCRDLNVAANNVRQGLWRELMKHPLIGFIAENVTAMRTAGTVKERMHVLAKVLNRAGQKKNVNPKDDVRRFCDLADQITYGNLMSLAKRSRDSRLSDELNPNLVSQSKIDAILYSLVKKGDMKDIRPLVSQANSDSLPGILSHAMEMGRDEVVQLLLKERLFNVNEPLIDAARNNKPEYIRMILKSSNPYTTTFCKFGGMNEHRNATRGLQQALITAVGHTNMEALEALLEAKPDIKMLKHLCALAEFYELYKEAEAVLGVHEAYKLLCYHQQHRISNSPFDEEDDQIKNGFRARIPKPFRGHDMLRTEMSEDGDRTAIKQRLEQELKARSDEEPLVVPLPPPAPPAIQIEEIFDEILPAIGGNPPQIEEVPEEDPEPLVDPEIPQEVLLGDAAANNQVLAQPLVDNPAVQENVAAVIEAPAGPVVPVAIEAPLAAAPVAPGAAPARDLVEIDRPGDAARVRNQFILGVVLSLFVYFLQSYANE